MTQAGSHDRATHRASGVEAVSQDRTRHAVPTAPPLAQLEAGDLDHLDPGQVEAMASIFTAIGKGLSE
mgnify:CR=1 FL=1